MLGYTSLISAVCFIVMSYFLFTVYLWFFCTIFSC